MHDFLFETAKQLVVTGKHLWDDSNMTAEILLLYHL